MRRSSPFPSLLVSIVALTVLCTVASPAQQTGTVVGHVADSATGAPRRGATALIVTSGQRATANEQGRFVIPRVATGTQSLQVRAIGFRTVTRTIDVRANDTTTVEI